MKIGRLTISDRASAGIYADRLPGKPAAVRECLEILAPAIGEGVALLRGEDPHSPPTNTTEKP